MVKNCGDNTVLGQTPAEASANCQGKTNKVPVESFKQALRNLVSAERLNVLKPLSASEVEAYSKDGPNNDQIEAMVKELDKINAFITAYGDANANLIRKEELIKSLSSNKTRAEAIKKINAEIEKAINLIADQTKLTLTKFNTDQDKFLYTVLKKFDPEAKFPCGFSGSIDERIKDCSYQKTSSKEEFVLVTRTKEFKEVHKDTKSGLLWGDRLPSAMSHYSAEKACNASLAEVAKLSGHTWRLPSKEEFEQAEKDGVRKALPNMNYWWWSSSVRRNNSDYAWLFVGYYGGVGDFGFRYSRDYNYSVRCVAK